MGESGSTPPTDEADKLPRHTTPTWEVELLISGVAVFAMLQLPGWLNEHMLMLLPRLDAALRAPVVGLIIYASAASTIMAVTFTIYLLLRAQWIARVGMHSVFPEGVRWEKLRGGPLMRALEQKMIADPAAAIERADNRASIVFAVGVSLATMQIVLTVGIAVLFPIGYGLVRLFTPQVDGALVFNLVLMTLFVPWGLTVLLDRIAGGHIDPDGRIARAMTSLMRAYAQAGFGNGSSNLSLLYSRYGRRRMGFVVGLGIVACLALVTLSLVVNQDADRFGSYSWFPEFTRGNVQRLDAAHYDDQRDVLRDEPAPYVQSAVIAGDFLRLVVPYRPEGDIPAQRQRCAGALAIGDETARATSLLQCLGGLHAVVLDGKALPEVRYDAGSDPRTHRPALVAMIDVRALAPGRHELIVARPQRPAHKDDPTVDAIAFWR